VTDTGIGIPPEKQDTIFDVFSQADAATTRKYGGTGLGLAISSQLVEMMDSRISVESTPGKGSTFHFAARFDLQQDRPAPPEDEDVAGLPNVSVLLVDDNTVSRCVLGDMLTYWGMNVKVADSGAGALAALNRAQDSGEALPRLLLIDALMPGMNGFALARRIRRNREWREIAAVMLTPADKPDDARYRAEGITAQVIKPARQTVLLDAVLTALGKKTVPERLCEVAQHLSDKDDRSLRILLAEDDKVNQQVAVKTLEKWDHEITVAENGKEALAAHESGAFDLILMDCRMPEMDGYQATAAIRRLEENTGEHVPIIAMTAHAMKGDRQRCIDAGMDDYISKPFGKQELRDVIRR
ncbi:MAG: response regulator, partial [Phycisphaerae bacterium]|nr:response regulator [Phycisphaerae bacterium]